MAPGELTVEDLQCDAVAAIVDLVTKCFSNSESPCHPQCFPQSFRGADEV